MKNITIAAMIVFKTVKLLNLRKNIEIEGVQKLVMQTMIVKINSTVITKD